MRTWLWMLLIWTGTAGLALWLTPRAGAYSGGSGQSVVEQLVGEGRKALSFSLFDRAELYFHGGVESWAASCPDQNESLHGSALAKNDAGGTDHAEEETHEHHPDATAAGVFRDWWSWLDAQVHPTDHTHLSGERFEKEVLPWVWAAAQSDPENVLAWSVGAYWLARRLDRVEEGLRFLAEGIRANPDSSELEFCRGEILLEATRDPARAYAAFRTALTKWKPGQTAEAMDDRNFERVRILDYLGLLEERNDDLDQARAHYREALTILPGNRAARMRLDALEKQR